jgi:hypothetical protein
MVSYRFRDHQLPEHQPSQIDLHSISYDIESAKTNTTDYRDRDFGDRHFALVAGQPQTQRTLRGSEADLNPDLDRWFSRRLL